MKNTKNTHFLAETNDLLLDINKAHGFRIPDDRRNQTLRSCYCNTQVYVVTVHDFIALKNSINL